jgi:hypothetical protein
MRLETGAQLGLGRGRFVQQALVDDIADIGGGEMDAQLGRESILRPDQERLVGLLVELLLTERQEPDTPLEAGAEGSRESSQPVDAILAREDVLGNLVHHQKQRGVGSAEAQHVADGAHGIFRGLVAQVRACAAREPGHRVGVIVREESGHDQREVFLGEVASFDLLPGLAKCVLCHLLETCPVSVAFEGQLEIGHQRLGGTVAEAALELPDGDGMDLLVVAGNAADIEDDGDGIDLAAQRGPGIPQLRGTRRGVAAQPRLGQCRPVRQRNAVEGEPQQLGEAGLAGSVKADIQAFGRSGPPGLSSSAAWR